MELSLSHLQARKIKQENDIKFKKIHNTYII